MDIEIFKKTGECYVDNGFGREWDGDEGEYVTRHIDDDDCYEIIARHLADEYFGAIPFSAILKPLARFIKDEMGDDALDNYRDIVVEYVQEMEE